MRIFKKMAVLAVVLVLTFSLIGCAGTMRAIEHSNMTTNVKMSDSIILDVQTLVKNKNIYIRITNTSEMQEIAFESILKDYLSKKGYSIVSDPSVASYILQANILYMDYQKDSSMTADGMMAGGFGGALLGSGIGGGRESIAGALGVGIVGSIIGGLAGKLIHVDTFLGVVDLQIQEKVEGEVTGTVKADVKQGTSTSVVTERKIQSNYQTYRTRLVAQATRTNINKEEAAMAISEKIARQVSGLF